MPTITLSRTDWQQVIATLRETGLDHEELTYMLVHAYWIEQLLETHGANELVVTLTLTGDVFHCSYNWARWRLGIPRPSN
jgi:hypothetical protein